MAGAQIDLDDLKINREGEVPIGVQLAWALRARIGDGRLAPGQRLPGLRELAELVGINANTARAVYQRLEQEGLIDSRQGTGTFVASLAKESSAIGQIAADAAREARRTGVDPREVAAALYVTTEPPPHAQARAASATEPLLHARARAAGATAGSTDPPEGATAPSAARAAERRRELRGQIAALEQTLLEIQALNPGLIPAPSKPSRHAGPRLLSVAELERVRAQLVRRLAEAEPLLEAPADRKRAASRSRKSATSAATQAEEPQAGQAVGGREGNSTAPEHPPLHSLTPHARAATRPPTPRGHPHTHTAHPHTRARPPPHARTGLIDLINPISSFPGADHRLLLPRGHGRPWRSPPRIPPAWSRRWWRRRPW